MIKSAHDITIEAILSFFDFTTSEPISYAARIVIETWKIENEEKIKILYQGNVISINGKELNSRQEINDFIQNKFQKLFKNENISNICQMR